jgi:hypothetical protein
MFMILVGLLTMAEAGAKIGHVPAWARGVPPLFHRLTTLLLLPPPARSAARGRQSLHYSPAVADTRMNRGRKRVALSLQQPRLLM